jgi:hypothetical protein
MIMPLSDAAMRSSTVVSRTTALGMGPAAVTTSCAFETTGRFWVQLSYRAMYPSLRSN